MVDPDVLHELFDRAVSLPPADRAAFLARACGDNSTLREQVERLLAADVQHATVFDTAHPSSDPSDASLPRPDTVRLSLKEGARLGRYQILTALGAGGMGEVYKARDIRLDRTVALKVLPSGLTNDPAARQRFEREARAVAALSHRHICPLFDIGQQDDVDFLVMEYVDGETLGSRLASGKLPLDEVLTYAAQIAEALDTAHQAGIVHRDLKPGNVMLTRSGAKLLDFGLAKRQPRPVTGERTTVATQPVTRAGLILGTVQYMAPEQLEGKPADARTDIFAFGAVLYEMLTGRRAFDGTSDASLIGNILHADPPAPSSIAPMAPKQLDDLVRRCLAKTPSDRVASMAELLAQLVDIREVRTRGRPGSRVRWAPSGVQRRLALLGAVALLVGVAAVVGWHWLSQAAAPAPQAERAPVQRNLTRLTFDDGLQTDPTFSPDGRFIAYASDKGGNFDIWVQPVAGGDAVQVTKSPATDTQPSWSPDGGTIAFRSERDGGGIYLVAALGGTERLLVEQGVHPSWSSDGNEVRFMSDTFTNWSAQLSAVALSGETSPHAILPGFTARGSWRWIGGHPDGRISFLGNHSTLGFGFFTVSASGKVTSSRINTKPLELLFKGGDIDTGVWGMYDQRFQWNRTGTALLLQASTQEGVKNLWKVQVDPATLDWTSFERLTTGAGMDMTVAIAPDGNRAVFSTQRVSVRLWQFPFDKTGTGLAQGLALTDGSADVLSSNVARDAEAVVFNLKRLGAAEPVSLWAMDLESRRSQPLGTNALFPTWSPDHQQVAYQKAATDEKTGAWMTAVAIQRLGGREHFVTPWVTGKSISPGDWSRDGTAVVVCSERLETWAVADAPVAAPSRILMQVPNATLWQARFSPNGRWLTFVAVRDSGVADVGVTTADGSPDREWTRVATDHQWVDKPRWAADGRRLYFLANRGSYLNLWAVDFDPQGGFPVGKPFAITHFDSPSFRISPAVASSDIDISSRHAFLTLHTVTGNVWMLDNVDR